MQGPVEDGLVHVDIALPDYKLALFLENAHEQPGQEPSSSSSSRSFADGTTLNGYACCCHSCSASVVSIRDHGALTVAQVLCTYCLPARHVLKREH